MKSFPFWKYSLNTPEEMMYCLKNEQYNIIEKNNEPILIRTYPEDYMKCDHISNHFTEYERINCHFADKPSPMEVWKSIINKNKDILNLTPFEQREILYSSTKECNTFNVSFCLWILKSLVGNGSKILDPSSGWGDRLIAAIASDAELYHGTDPNIKLQKGYNDIKKTFLNKENMSKFTVKKLPFEDIVIKYNYYDIALTSPPYFNLEKYNDSKNQSMNRYSKYEEWLLFYKHYLYKMVNAVKQNGFIVVYVEDIFSKGVSYKIREYTIDIMDKYNTTEHTKYSDCTEYEKCSNIRLYKKFGLKVGKQIRWALVWQKN